MTCTKCGGKMQDGKILQNYITVRPYIAGVANTYSKSKRCYLAKCKKCKECGHSES